MLDITNGSFDTINQTKNSSMINSIDVNSNSSRPPSSNLNNNTFMDFYKLKKNGNFLDSENSTNITRTQIDWKVANLINQDDNNNLEGDTENENEGKQKVFNGIKSILASNKKRLKEISFIQNNNNKIEESFDNIKNDFINNNNNNNFNIDKKGLGFETEKIFPNKGIVFNPIKTKTGGININNNTNTNTNEDNTVKKVIKKPIIFKGNYAINSNINNNKILNKTEDNIDNINLNSELKLQSSTLNNFAKFKKEGQPVLKPILKKKIISNLDENCDILKTEDNPIRLINNFNDNKISEKPVLKKPIIFKQANTNINSNININNNNITGSDSPMSKRIFLNSAVSNTSKVKKFKN
jgi:hypothetical protein